MRLHSCQKCSRDVCVCLSGICYKLLLCSISGARSPLAFCDRLQIAANRDRCVFFCGITCLHSSSAVRGTGLASSTGKSVTTSLSRVRLLFVSGGLSPGMVLLSFPASQCPRAHFFLCRTDDPAPLPAQRKSVMNFVTRARRHHTWQREKVSNGFESAGDLVLEDRVSCALHLLAIPLVAEVPRHSRSMEQVSRFS